VENGKLALGFSIFPPPSSAAYRRRQGEARIEVVPFRAELIAAAVRLYEARPDKTWGLTDCLSFVVMEQHQLADALTDGSPFQAGRPEGHDA
jgi:predicted nucleic acid-binding protein